MRSRLLILAAAGLCAAFIAAGDRTSAQEPAPAAQHDHAGMPRMGPMPKPDMAEMMAKHAAESEALLKLVNESVGTAKVDAIATLLASLVEHQKMCAGMMGDHEMPAAK